MSYAATVQKPFIIVVLIIALLTANGCAAQLLTPGFGLNPGGYGEQRVPPDSDAYGDSVALGLLGDTLLIPFFGWGLVFWIFDVIYLWAWEGGYAQRWSSLNSDADQE